MTISEKSWEKFISDLRKVNQAATEKMAAFLAQFEDWTTPEVRQALIDYAFSLSTTYGEAAAELACEMYDSMAELSGANVPTAEPADVANIHEVAKAVNGTIKTENAEIIAGAVGRLVKMASVDTTMYNAIRDGAQWAWIPHGDTCAFCIALGSRGWQTATEKSLKHGHAGHVHAHCDCTYAVRFNDDTDFEGYDPKKYLKDYEDAPLDHWNTKDGKPPKGHSESDETLSTKRINAMRRKAYGENKSELINVN